jgi:hypothetical protein
VAELSDSGESRRFFGYRITLVAVACGVLLAWSGAAAWASSWGEMLKSGSKGEARATTVPAVPAGVAAVCTSSSAKTVQVSWTAVAKATSYTIYDATTSATGTYASMASGVTTASWTSASLTAGNYWFEVVALVGTNWVSAKSTASGESTTSSTGCVQP